MIGVDLVLVESFRCKAEGFHGVAFLARIFSDDELRLVESLTGLVRARSLAGHFAAKEAVIKASMGAYSIRDLLCIRLVREPQGTMLAVVDRGASGPRCFEVSISHDGDYAIAVALETKRYPEI